MFDFLSHSPLGFWVVALLIIAIDSTLLLQPGQFTYIFENGLNVKVRVVGRPYCLAHKEPVVTLLAYPIVPFFISSIDEPAQGRHSIKMVLLKQKRTGAKSRQLTYLALLSLILIGLIGPLVSLEYGIERGLIAVIPALYVTVVFGGVVIWLNRSILGVSGPNIAYICFELIVCPILFVNIFKKIAMRNSYTCTSDLIGYFTKNKTQIRNRLKEHMEAIEQ